MDKETQRELGVVSLTLAVLGALFIVLAAAVGGIWWWLVAGVVIVAAIAVSVVMLGRRERAAALADPPPVSEVREEDGVRRVLVIADGDCGRELPAHIRSHVSGPVEAEVRAPVLGSRLAVITGDDRAYDDARVRLDHAIAQLKEAGIPADGRLGAADPLRTAVDGLREFAADEVVFAIRGGAEFETAERNLLARAEEFLAIPVSSVGPRASADD